MRLWHIVTATHNSRCSQRMFNYRVHRGEPRLLTEKEELVITETVAEIVEKDHIFIPAYNICKDHMHFVLICEKEEVPKIVGKIKAMTARAANIAAGRTRGHAPLSAPGAPGTRGETQCHLWVQKFYRKEIRDNEQYLNTVHYIRNNRIKHKLPASDAIKTATAGFICTIADAKNQKEENR